VRTGSSKHQYSTPEAAGSSTHATVLLQIVCLTDLENDYINPYDLSSKMNRFVVGVVFWQQSGCSSKATTAACKCTAELSVREHWPAYMTTVFILSFFGIGVIQVHELITQAVIAALLLVSRNWFTGICHAAVLVYMLHLHNNRHFYVDTTDAFRQLPQQKKQRFVLLAAHLLLFIVVVYR